MLKRFGIIILCLLAVVCCASFGAMAEDATPTPPPLVTPAPERLAGLTFIIDGPDPRMPMTVTYADLTDGSLRLEDLDIGTYTVTEVDPDKLLEDFTFEAENSTTTAVIEVTKGGSVTAELVNVYATATPMVTPSVVSLPVTKVWDDDNNQDGNRPGSVTVYANANGAPVASATLSEAGGWSYTFTDLPYADAEGNPITYTLSEAAVPLYESRVEGETIINTYRREVTEVSVRKVWIDNNNEARLRPTSIYCTLSNGTTVLLNEANGWSATVSGLPAYVNGQPAVYTWREQEAVGYEQIGLETSGSVTTFTNRLWQRPEEPTGGKVPPTRGNPLYVFDDYETPLGVDVVINHVGDCFE